MSQKVLTPYSHRHIALSYDYPDDNDTNPVILVAGCEPNVLTKVFDTLQGGEYGGYQEYDMDIQRSCVMRQGFADERFAVTLYDYRRDIILPETLLLIASAKIKDLLPGAVVDIISIDEILNLSSARLPKRTKKNTTPMANIYLRVPWFVADFYRGREEKNQLTEWQPVEFSAYSSEYALMNNNLLKIPPDRQTRECYSQVAWDNILKGYTPDGKRKIIHRDPSKWPTPSEVCVCNGTICKSKQRACDYLCIKMPPDVYQSRKVLRTNNNYCLPYDAAVKLKDWFYYEFCREYLNWTEYDQECAKREGVNRSMTVTTEKFFAQFNFRGNISETSRDSLRRLHLRLLTNEKKHPAYLYHFNHQFLSHISDEELEKKARREKRNKKTNKQKK